jgi:hypothetical protein
MTSPQLTLLAVGQPLVQSLLPIVGVIIGWILKSGTDFLTAGFKERATRRKCTFYLLRAWKALLDYERFVNLASSSRPAIQEFEEQRRFFAQQFLSRVAEDKDSLVTGVDMLASIDPTAAAKLDNAIKNIRRVLESTFSDVVTDDPLRYVQAMNNHNDLLDWTLSHFKEMGTTLAKRSGLFQAHKVEAWFEARREASEFGDELVTFRKRFGPAKDRTFRTTLHGFSSESLRETFSDVMEWHKAKWRATAFDLRDEALPGLGMGFDNLEAGKRIFKHWIDQIGGDDSSNHIGVSIVEGPIPGEPAGYTVLVYYDTQPIDKKSLHMHRMVSSDGAPNLQRFKAAYAAAGRYRLFPAQVDDNTVTAIDASLSIEKRNIRFLDSSKVKPNEIEYHAVQLHD